MRLTEKKLRRVIRSVIAESEFDGTMNPEDPLEHFIEYNYLGQSPSGARNGRVKFSEVMKMVGGGEYGRIHGGHATMDDVLVAIASKPNKYALDGCHVIFKDFVDDHGPDDVMHL